MTDQLEGHSVQFCDICRCKTWHVDGVCEWADGHETMKRVRETGFTHRHLSHVDRIVDP